MAENVVILVDMGEWSDRTLRVRHGGCVHLLTFKRRQVLLCNRPPEFDGIWVCLY